VYFESIILDVGGSSIRRLVIFVLAVRPHNREVAISKSSNRI
jgi:hypothetical protein